MARIADEDLESARTIMRRLMWSLNDESGGIGWGAAEAMGEIMARQARLAEEYHRILVSYIRDDGNRLDHEALETAVLWGIGRLAQARPELLSDAACYIFPYLQSGNSEQRGLAAWALGFLGATVPAHDARVAAGRPTRNHHLRGRKTQPLSSLGTCSQAFSKP